MSQSFDEPWDYLEGCYILYDDEKIPCENKSDYTHIINEVFEADVLARTLYQYGHIVGFVDRNIISYWANHPDWYEIREYIAKMRSLNVKS
jgi:hypothetical protein